MCAKMAIFGILLHVPENRYAVSISDDSVVKSDEITEKTKTGPTKSILTNAVQVNFNEKKNGNL